MPASGSSSTLPNLALFDVKTRAGAAFNDPDAPGLIVEWARGRNDLWNARVVHLPDRGTVVDEWFPYTRLTPITTA
jgi:hypothetical protein